MKYNIIISGEYSNIKGLQVDQTFYAILKCSACNYTHPKKVVLTTDSTIKEPGVYKCNFELTCQSCRNDLKVNFKKPSTMVKHTVLDKYDDEHEIEYCSINVDGCLVSIVEVKGGELVDISASKFTVLTKDDKLFYDCIIDDKKCLAGEYGKSKIYSILNCEYKLSEVR